MFFERRSNTPTHISGLWDSTFRLSELCPFLYHFHMSRAWVNRTSGGSLAWNSPLHLSPLLNPGNQEGISKELGWPACIQIPKFQGIDRWVRGQVISHPYKTRDRPEEINVWDTHSFIPPKLWILFWMGWCFPHELLTYFSFHPSTTTKMTTTMMMMVTMMMMMITAFLIVYCILSQQSPTFLAPGTGTPVRI